MLVNFAGFLSLADFQKILRNTNRMSNSLDPDQTGLSVGPDLDPCCLKRLSADSKNCHYQAKS